MGLAQSGDAFGATLRCATTHSIAQSQRQTGHRRSNFREREHKAV